MASAGIWIVELTVLPNSSGEAISKRMPFAEIFTVIAGISPWSVRMVIGIVNGKRTAALSSVRASTCAGTPVFMWR
jgi:hypothetical protein